MKLKDVYRHMQHNNRTEAARAHRRIYHEATLQLADHGMVSTFLQSHLQACVTYTMCTWLNTVAFITCSILRSKNHCKEYSNLTSTRCSKTMVKPLFLY